MIKVKATFRGLKNWRVHMKTASVKSNPQLGLFGASTAERLMNPFVPMREGFLSGTVGVTPFHVTYFMIYAAYQYYGGWNYSTHMHPQATGLWDRAMVEQQGQNLAADMTRYLRGL